MNRSLPPTPESRDRIFRLRLSDFEDEDLRRRAEQRGIAASDVVRLALWPMSTMGMPSYDERLGSRKLALQEQRAESMKANSEFRERVDRDEAFEREMEERRRRRQQETADE